MSRLQVQLDGVPEALAALDKFGKGIRNKHLKIGLNAAGGVMKPEVQKRAPKQTGTLAKSQIVKVKVNTKKGIAYALIGAKRGIKVSTTVTKKDGLVKLATWTTRKDGVLTVSGQGKYEKAIDAKQSIRYRVPSRYSHLVEGGTKRGVRARRYMASTVATKKNAAARAFIRKLRQGAEEEARKARTT